jgi:hypothetical protein
MIKITCVSKLDPKNKLELVGKRFSIDVSAGILAANGNGSEGGYDYYDIGGDIVEITTFQVDTNSEDISSDQAMFYRQDMAYNDNPNDDEGDK